MDMEEGVALPADEVRCRRRGTPNWRCPQRALPGKSQCLKHYLLYVSRRRKTPADVGERLSTEIAVVEPYRPIIDFDSHESAVQTGFNGEIALPGEIMDRLGNVDLWNGKIALDEPVVGSGGVNDDETHSQSQPPDILEECRGIGGALVFDKVRLVAEFEGYMDFDWTGHQKPKRGRPIGSKNKKKVEESGNKTRGGIDQDENRSSLDDDDDRVRYKRRERENLNGTMRARHLSESSSEKDEGFEDQIQWATLGHDGGKYEGLWCNNMGEVPTFRNGKNHTIILNKKKKKQGRP